MSKKISFTLVTTNGSRWDASSIHKTYEDGTGKDAVTIICSGIAKTFPVEEVVSIETSVYGDTPVQS